MGPRQEMVIGDTVCCHTWREVGVDPAEYSQHTEQAQEECRTSLGGPECLVWARDVAQLVQCLPCLQKALALMQKPCLKAHNCNASTWGVETRDLELKAILGYLVSAQSGLHKTLCR